MKIATTYEDGNIYQHFGHSKQFKVFTIENNAIKSSEVLSCENNAHGALANLLKEWGVSTLICGGIGKGAKDSLTAADIKFYAGTNGNADDQVKDLLSDKLVYNPDTECDHHNHEHKHDHN